MDESGMQRLRMQTQLLCEELGEEEKLGRNQVVIRISRTITETTYLILVYTEVKTVEST